MMEKDFKEKEEKLLLKLENTIKVKDKELEE